LGESEDVLPSSDVVDIEHQGFSAEVELSSVSFRYPNQEDMAIQNVSVKLSTGKVFAIVGSSGAGKTTLVDLLLGVLEPESGKVRISGQEPSDVVQQWPGAIAYVPQDVIISNGSIRENVALGYPMSSATDSLVWKAIETAQLRPFVESLSNGLDTSVGDRGTRISGGQRQRLGIARAMFTQPKLLVLDEATSALDGQTEKEIINSIASLRGQVTVLVVAHRLATVRMVDQLIYMDQGKIVDIGSFDEVRARVPDFDSQAKLMGL
jgi:ABC-type multidrug transport system fused ATPase/permease subunit